MKYIIAIIQPHKLDEVMAMLEAAEVPLVTVSNVLGRGRQKGVTEVYRGAREAGSLLKKVKLEIAVNEDFVAPTIDALIKGAHTGEIGFLSWTSTRWSGSEPESRAARPSVDSRCLQKRGGFAS
jgi:nitrogen regulatory protein P-II 2